MRGLKNMKNTITELTNKAISEGRTVETFDNYSGRYVTSPLFNEDEVKAINKYYAHYNDEINAKINADKIARDNAKAEKIARSGLSADEYRNNERVKRYNREIAKRKEMINKLNAEIEMYENKIKGLV